MRLRLALHAIEDLRDEAELSKDADERELVGELNECLQVLRQYAGDTAEHGLPTYVAFLWGNGKAKMGRYTKPALRIHQAQERAQMEMASARLSNFRIVSSIEECEALRKEIDSKELHASIDYYLNWCTKNGSKPFRYLK